MTPRLLIASKQDFEQVAQLSLRPLRYEPTTEAEVVAALDQTDMYHFDAHNLTDLPEHITGKLIATKYSLPLKFHSLEDTCFVYEKQEKSSTWFKVLKPNLIPVKWGLNVYLEIVREDEDTKMVRVHGPIYVQKVWDLQGFSAEFTDEEILCHPLTHQRLNENFPPEPAPLTPAQDLLSRFPRKSSRRI